MAKCDTGYFCRVCGEYVAGLTDSALYLRYVLGEVPFGALFHEPDAHITCVPELAGLIDHPDFAAAKPAGTGPAPGTEGSGPPRSRERVTRAWLRLQDIPGSGLEIPDYPLPPDA